MSVRSRVANEMGPLLSLALTAACAHGASAPAATPTIYENGRGEKIVIAPGAITIGGVAHSLTDCSDADFFCAASEEIGFRISFPRRCPAYSWFPNAGPMRWSSGFPHSFGSRYLNRDRSNFLYDWEPRSGLVSLVYDPERDFAQLPANYVHGGPTAFYRRSGPRLFACR